MKYLLTLLAALCVALATPAGAAPYTFTALSTTSPYGLNTHHWPDAANWAPLTGPPVGATSHDVTFPTLSPSLLVGSGAQVISDGPLVTLLDITFNATHPYLVALSNCTPMQINGTLTQNGIGDSFLHGQSGRLHLNNPVLAGPGGGGGLLTVFHPESVTGPIMVTGGNHEWQIAANAPCRPGGGPPTLTLGSLTFSGPGTFRLRSDVDVTFGGPVTLTGGATFCVMSLSGGATINASATPSWIVAGGMLKYGAGISGGSGAIIVSAGGMFAAGCSVATATVGGDLTFTSTGMMEFELGTPGVVGGGVNDLLNVQGVLTLDGTLLVVPQAGFGPGTYRLYNYSGTLTDNGVTITGVPAGLTGTLNTATPGQVNLIVTQGNNCGPLSILRASANIIVQWPGGCQLQSTASLDEPIAWTPLPVMTSPATLPISGAKQFFRTVAPDGSCSPNTVGYVNHTLADGQRYLLANPLNGTNNHLNTILPLPVAADGTTLIRWSSGIPSDPITYIASDGWDNNVSVSPGEGFFFDVVSPGGLSVTFIGEVPQGNLINPLPSGLSLKSSIAPQQGQLGGTLGFPAQDGDVVSVWNPVTQTFKEPFTYIDGFGWESSNTDDPGPAGPVIPVGTGFLVQRSGPGGWIRTFAVNQCAPPPPPCTNELRFACAGTTNHVFTAGGTNDNFTGPQPASPSAGLAGRYSTLVGFDECPTSAIFAHTFSNLPPCIRAARLCVRLKPCDVLNCGDEAINLGFTAPNSQPLAPGYWTHYLGTGNPGPGLINYNWCNATAGEIICLDLANLPPGLAGGATDLLPFLNQYGFLDFTAGNESAVDWIRLEIESCCCHEDINVPNDPGLCSALVQYVPPTAIGGCSPNVTVTCTPPSGLFPAGTTTVTCVATNEAGQSAICTFLVTVRDTEPPAFICPTNAILAVDCSIPALSISATDNCTPAGQLTFTQTPPANTPVGPGLHPVGINFCDAAGNCSPCTVLVEVRGVQERIFSIRTGLACGVALPVGGKDPNFIAIGYEGLGLSGLGDATVMPPSEFGPGWLPNNGVSQWVHATGSNYQTLGYTAYRVTFLLPCTNAVISGRFAGHQAAVLRINGVNVAGAGPTAWRSVHYTGPFVVGLNTLDIITEDFAMTGEGNPGIRAELDAVAECCGCPTFTPTACLPPPSGLTHWYPGNPDARDVTGRNPGVLESGALAAQPGHVGRAFRFDGTTGGVDLGNVPDFDFDQCSSFSIEGWFNSTGPGSIEQTVVALNYDNNGLCAVTVQAVVLVPHDAVSDVVRFIIRDAANTASTLTSPPVAKNAFHHFAAVRDATAMPHQMRLYVDCQLVAQGTDVTTAALARYGSDFIGRRNACNAANVFNGFIDELSFYNRPLSGYEVAQISANGSRGKCHPSCYPTLQGSLGWWAGNANANDTSGKGRHGTMRDGAGFAPGAVRQSFRFDGMNDYMHVPAHPSLNPSGPITLGAWVNPEQYPVATAVIAGKPFGFQLDLLPNGRARFAVPVSASVFLSVDTSTALPLNQFTHLTATYGYGLTLSSRRLDIYVDGVLNNTLHDAGAPVIYHPPGAPFQIGGFNHSSFVGGFFKGRLDEVRLLNGVLSAMDIKAMGAAGSRGPCPGAILPIVNAGQLLLEWEGEGVLERASGLGQPWQELPEATSPHVVPTDGSSGFFRIKIIDTGYDD